MLTRLLSRQGFFDFVEFDAALSDKAGCGAYGAGGVGHAAGQEGFVFDESPGCAFAAHLFGVPPGVHSGGKTIVFNEGALETVALDFLDALVESEGLEGGGRVAGGGQDFAV